MEKHQKGSDGRRLFSAEFKQEAVRSVTSGEITAAELSRELRIQPSLPEHWKRRITSGARVAVTANEDIVLVRSSRRHSSAFVSWSVPSARTPRRSISSSRLPGMRLKEGSSRDLGILG